MNWDPLQELVALRDRATRRPSSQDASWTPSVDLLETDASFIIVVELPGVEPDDFAISATTDGIVLTGQRRPLTPPPARFLRMERGHGRFSRAFAFAEPVDTSSVQASFDRGLLSILVPKGAPTSEGRIPIR
jgi:HSP20 family protein